MASSKVVMASSRSSPNPDLPTHPSSSSLNLNSDHTRGFGSVNMDDIFRNIYSNSDTFALVNNDGAVSGGGDGGIRNGNRTVDDVWKDIVSGGGGGGVTAEPAMTLEDFLAKAQEVNDDGVRVPAVMNMAPPPPTTGGASVGMMETAMMAPAMGVPFASAVCVQDGLCVDFGNGMPAVSGGVAGSGRRKRRAAAEEAPVDKATQQKQRRMIKNRESAARSRERKQAYTVELEALVAQLEEDNARLLKAEAELKKERYKQLMENLIPVVESRRPPRYLRRVHSMEW